MASVKRNLSVDLLEINEGQLYGLPKNPRWIRDARYNALKRSIEDAPEMLDLRELLVYPLDDVEGKKGKYIIIGGNMRFRACTELGYKEIPCKVLDIETPVKKLREYVIKDNEAFGQNDFDLLANEWDSEELQDFGMEQDYLNYENPDMPADGSGEGGEGGGDETHYSRNIEAPTYEITGKEPTIDECVDMSAVKSLISDIEASGLTPEKKEFLKICAYRHAKLNFENIAEYYAHQDKEMQSLMEDSALVIIDFDKALQRGYAEMNSRLLSLIPDDADKNARFDYDEE